MKNFTGKVLLLSFIVSGLITKAVERAASRAPAGLEEGFELTIQNLSAYAGSKIEKLDNVTINAVFNNKESVQLGQGQKYSVKAGETLKLDAHIDIKPKWITQDGLEFRIELVDSGFFKNVLLRCSTISKGLSVYNRAYTCTVPAEQSAILTYRVARKGAPLPGEGQDLAQLDN